MDRKYKNKGGGNWPGFYFRSAVASEYCSFLNWDNLRLTQTMRTVLSENTKSKAKVNKVAVLLHLISFSAMRTAMIRHPVNYSCVFHLIMKGQ